MNLIIDFIQGTLLLSFVCLITILTVGSIDVLTRMFDRYDVRTIDKVVAFGWLSMLLFGLIFYLGAIV
jgi:hypothetical protein